MSSTLIDIPAAVYCPEAPVPYISEPPRIDFIVLPRLPEKVGVGRSWTRDMLAAFGVPDNIIDNAALVVSEYAQNAVRHVTTASTDPGVMTFTVAVWADRLRLTVSDPGDLFEVTGPGPNGSGEHETGYGLTLVDALTEGCHGVERVHGGKIAWAELKLVGEGGV